MDRRAHDEDAEREETPRRARAEVFRSCMLDDVNQTITRRAMSDGGLVVNLLFDRLENRKRSVWREGKAATEGVVRLLQASV